MKMPLPLGPFSSTAAPSCFSLIHSSKFIPFENAVHLLPLIWIDISQFPFSAFLASKMNQTHSLPRLAWTWNEWSLCAQASMKVDPTVYPDYFSLCIFFDNINIVKQCAIRSSSYSKGPIVVLDWYGLRMRSHNFEWSEKSHNKCHLLYYKDVRCKMTIFTEAWLKFSTKLNLCFKMKKY